MDIKLVPYETCFRVLVNGIKTPVTIEFLPAGETMDVEANGKYVADMLLVFSWIEESDYDETIRQVVGQLS